MRQTSNPQILYFGFGVREQEWLEILRNSKGMAQTAAQRVSWEFVEGLDAANEGPVDVLSSMRVGTFPNFHKIILFNHPSWNRVGDDCAMYAPYINLPGMVYLTVSFSAIYRIFRWWVQRRNCAEKQVVIVYSMYSPHMIASVLCSRILGMKSILIVPDLVDYMKTENIGFVEGVLRKVNNRLSYILAGNFDGFVFFTEEMKNKVITSNKKWRVVEGCVKESSEVLKGLKKLSKKRPYFMYSGAITKRYGILVLIEAFKNVKSQNCELIICGSGQDAEVVRREASCDNRIKFLGMLKSSNHVTQLQQSALALINPRQSSEQYTHYSFPSKNMEFMLAGRPTIVCSMNGIPKEYEKHLIVVSCDGVESLSKAIESVLMRDRDELDRIGTEARDFIVKCKNNKVQGRVIYSLAKEI